MNGWVNGWICPFQMISQEPNQGVDFEYYLPNGRSRQGYFWSYGSWAACSKECGSGERPYHLVVMSDDYGIDR